MVLTSGACRFLYSNRIALISDQVVIPEMTIIISKPYVAALQNIG